MTNKKIYNQIVNLTGKVATTEVGAKIVEAAKTGKAKQVEEVFETFKSQNSDLYQAILKFKEEYKNARTPTIFAETSKKGVLFEYDPEKIDIFNFYILLFFAEMTDIDLFLDLEIATELLKEKKHPKMAEYFENYGPQYPCYDMLVEIFSENKN